MIKLSAPDFGHAIYRDRAQQAHKESSIQKKTAEIYFTAKSFAQPATPKDPTLFTKSHAFAVTTPGFQDGLQQKFFNMRTPIPASNPKMRTEPLRFTDQEFQKFVPYSDEEKAFIFFIPLYEALVEKKVSSKNLDTLIKEFKEKYQELKINEFPEDLLNCLQDPKALEKIAKFFLNKRINQLEKDINRADIRWKSDHQEKLLVNKKDLETIQQYLRTGDYQTITRYNEKIIQDNEVLARRGVSTEEALLRFKKTKKSFSKESNGYIETYNNIARKSNEKILEKLAVYDRWIKRFSYFPIFGFLFTKILQIVKNSMEKQLKTLFPINHLDSVVLSKKIDLYRFSGELILIDTFLDSLKKRPLRERFWVINYLPQTSAAAHTKYLDNLEDGLPSSYLSHTVYDENLGRIEREDHGIIRDLNRDFHEQYSAKTWIGISAEKHLNYFLEVAIEKTGKAVEDDEREKVENYLFKALKS